MYDHEKQPCTYIMASRSGVLYVGVTSNIYRRAWEHKQRINPTGFAARYHCERLVWFDYFPTMVDAIRFEKYLKGKKREFKIDLIVKQNPDWKDLAAEWGLEA